MPHGCYIVWQIIMIRVHPWWTKCDVDFTVTNNNFENYYLLLETITNRVTKESTSNTILLKGSKLTVEGFYKSINGIES